MFEYDSSPPLVATLESRRLEDGVAREELTYESPGGGRVSATLLSTAAARPPGIVFLHWGFGDRSSFFDEARLYAAAGAMALLVDAPGMGARGRGLPRLGDANVARSFLHQCVTDLRRGIDLLIARGADPQRIAYVGHSLGATVGGPLAGIEPRLAAIVLMAGFGEVSKGGWALRPDDRYAQAMRPFDGTKLIGASRAAILFQFATRDDFVSLQAAERFIAAAPPASRVEWYDADHRLSNKAVHDRAAWLGDRLGLRSLPSEALDRVRLPGAQIRRYGLIRRVYAVVSWLMKRR